MSRCVVNHALAPGEVPAPVHVAAALHERHPLYAPTPLRSLPGVASELGVGAVLVKDETSRLGLPAFKALGASWAIECALRRDPDVETVVAASAGNHGRAVARFARERGRHAVILLPARSNAVRRAAIEGEGATVVVVDGDYEDAVRDAEARGREPRAVVIADVGSTPSASDVIDGYATLFAEIERQLPSAADVLVVPVGVGSLAAAAARAAAAWGTRVVGVEPESAACLGASLAAGRPTAVPTPGTVMAGMDCAEVSPAAWPALRSGVAGTLTVADAEIPPARGRLAAHGLTAGECSAAGLAALKTLTTDDAARELRDHVGLTGAGSVVLLATEGDTGGTARTTA
jgi:diaminopropionate ammonia-lyase